MLCVSVRRGYDGPHDCGNYNSAAWETGFFVSQGGSWDTEYGHFFLGWYSSLLLQHADRVLKAAAASLNKRGRPRKARAAREHTDGHVVYEFDAACHLGVKLVCDQISPYQCTWLSGSCECQHLGF